VNTYPVVIVGTDGSATAAEAVRRAGILAGRLGSRLLVVTAFQRPRPEDLGPASQLAGQSHEALISTSYRGAAEAAQDAATMASRLVPGLDVDTATPEGDPAEALLDMAEANPGALLTVGSQGMSGSKRFLLGSVPNKVSHHIVGDLLILRTGAGRPIGAPASLLVGTDGSATAARAVDRAIAVAAGLGARLTVLTVNGDADAGRRVLDEACGRAAGVGVDCEPALRTGDPAEAIVAEGEHVDLVVLGSQGMTGAGRFLLGSVPNKVSHHGAADLLIVKTS
jgi:nucleotide-binding universal stress UspA family protein